jgi:hypothetical protein
MATRSVVLVACLVVVSTSCREAQTGSTAATTAIPTTVAPATTMTVAPAPTSPASREDVMGPTARLLVELGGRYLCDQRVYPHPPAPHLTVWEWAFNDEPGALAEKLAKRLTDTEREERTFRWKGADGSVEAVVSVEDASTEKSRLDCKNIPASTRSFVVASHR